MTRIMLVDDFTADRDAIAEMLESYHDLDIAIVAQCDNGESALDVLGQTRPDIIICDVEMPFMDGLSFAALARERLGAVRFIFCSLYERFEYVQSAVKLGSDGYVLKPVSAHELHERLSKVVKELDDLRLMRQQHDRLTEFVRQNRDMLTDVFFSDLIFGRIGQEEALEKSATLGVDLPDSRYGLAVVEIDDFWEAAHRPEFGSTTLLSLMARRVLGYALESIGNVRVVRLDDARHGLVFRLDPADGPDEANRRALGICEGIQDQFSASQISATIALVDAAVDFMGLSECYEQCQRQLDFKIMLGKGRIITPAEVFISSGAPELNINDMQKELRALLNTGRTEEIAGYVDAHFARCLNHADPGLPRVLSYCLMICVQLVLSEQDESLSGIGIEERLIWDKLGRYETIPDISMLFKNLLTAYANMLQQKRERQKSGFVERVCRYIAESENLGISLEDIARQFFYSPNYLNHIFKESTGKTIIEFLTECRMNRARALLQVPGKKISEISDVLGYRHATYFNHVFKTYFGVTPREYRAGMENDDEGS